METVLKKLEAKTPEEKNALQEYRGLIELEKLSESLIKGKSIEVKDISEIELISESREIRLFLKQTRNTIEKKRKELKENIVLRGKAIDGMANIFKDMIVPVEKHLEDQEKFAERLEEKRLVELAATREAKLAPYLLDLICYDLKTMSEQGFEQLLQSSKVAFEAQKEAKRKAEEIQKAKAEVERKEQEEIRKENERLKKEQEEKEREEAKRREKENKKLETEKKAREKAEAEARAIKEESLRKERELKEAEEKAKKAPDKEKLEQLALQIVGIKAPVVKSQKAKDIIGEVVSDLNRVAAVLKTKIAMM